MRKRFILALLSLIIASLFLVVIKVNAVSSGIVISQIQAGAESGLDQAALQEIVIIYNNSSEDIEITNWCLENKSSVKFACFSPAGPSVHLWLKSFGYATISSNQFNIQHSYTPDISYSPTNFTSGSIVSSSDSISLIDKSSTVIDNISWASSLTGGYNYKRNFEAASSTVMIDTDQLSDFTKSNILIVPASSLQEIVVIVDMCPNIDLIQENIPSGYMLDETGSCMVDVCANLNGLQIEIPISMEVNESGSCVYIDLCINLDGPQLDVPFGYLANNYKECFVVSSPLKITELMPNAIGKDIGGEFVEIYNPTDSAVSLDLYKFSVGVDVLKSFSFPIGAAIAPKSYYVLYNNQINFTLNNTASRLQLSTIDNQDIASSDAYLNAKEGLSWALIEGLWQFTNQPTPGRDNLASVESEVEITSNLVPCGPNQYRNPETNRCRSIVTASSTLKPCRDDQYRSEETGRCRAILGASTATEKPCPEGEYRNPETNRCKKTVAITKADYPSGLELTVSNPEYGLAFLSTVVILLAGYGIFEWRDEITRLYKRFRSIIAK